MSAGSFQRGVSSLWGRAGLDVCNLWVIWMDCNRRFFEDSKGLGLEDLSAIVF